MPREVPILVDDTQKYSLIYRFIDDVFSIADRVYSPLSLAEMFCVTKLSVGIYKRYFNAASLMLGCFGINC